MGHESMCDKYSPRGKANLHTCFPAERARDSDGLPLQGTAMRSVLVTCQTGLELK